MKKVMKLSKILIALTLVVSMFCSNVVKINATNLGNDANQSIVEVDGAIFDVTEDNSKCVLTGKEDGYEYEAVLDKSTSNIHISCNKDVLLWNNSIYDYDVDIQNYDKDNATLDYVLTDNNTGEETLVDNSEYLTGQTAIAIVGGIALADLILALLAVTAVCVVADVAYYAISDALEKVREESQKNQKYFYYAMVKGSDLLIGSAFKTEADALLYAQKMIANRTYGVFCIGAVRASNLAANVSPVFISYYDDAHYSGDGYRKHYHPKISVNGTSHFDLHCWY